MELLSEEYETPASIKLVSREVLAWTASVGTWLVALLWGSMERILSSHGIRMSREGAQRPTLLAASGAENS